MFSKLSDNLTKVFDKLKGRGFLSEADIDQAMREIRVSLLEADVSFPVVKELINKIREKAKGQEIIKSVSASNMVVKIVQDEIIAVLGGEAQELTLNAAPPVVIMMVGLQGSGKTTTTTKLALKLRKKHKKNPIVVSLDVYRPAAQQQLEIVAKQIGIPSLPIIQNEKPLDIAKRAMTEARLSAYDVILLDTAGRLHTDDELMRELQEIKKLSSPIETILVADAMTGQDAVNIAREFDSKVGVTSIILTRMDGDARGGAALSMRGTLEAPIKFIGVGESPNDLQEFYPERIASSILGMGDIVSLVEKAAETLGEQEVENVTHKVQKGTFDLNDLRSQLKNLRKMGGLGSMVGMIPGLGGLKKQMTGNVDEKTLARQEAIISSMTPLERRNPHIINAARKIRIANGSGTKVPDVNKLLKQFMDLSGAMKKFGKMDEGQMKKFGDMIGSGNIDPSKFF